MHYVEELHHGCAVVGDCLPAIFVDKQEIAAVWAQCAFDGRLNGYACVDVGDDLSSALRLVGTWSMLAGS